MRLITWISVGLTAMVLAGCSTPKAQVGLTGDNQLTPCPDSPNCVNSMPTTNGEHAIAPLATPANMSAPIKTLARIIRRENNTHIVTQTENYLHATYTSNIMGFVDDLELLKQEDSIAVRSASRTGYSDFGVNRKRVEALRTKLANAQ